MDPTSVKIRGKRYAHGQKPAQDLRKTRSKLKPKRISATPLVLNVEKSQAAERHRQSLLEALPPELLQYIFRLSANNLALLAASLPLSKKLSNDGLQSTVFIDVFSRRMQQAVTGNVSSFHLGSSTDVSDLQAALLNLKWLTYPWIMALLKRNPQAFVCMKEGEPYLDTVRIPVKLLQPPWTDDKCRFLGLLFRSDAYIDKTDSTDYEIACNSLTHAILDSDVSAVRSLLPVPRLARIDGLQKAPAAAGGVQPTSEHLQTAVLRAGCHHEIVECLLRVESSDMDRRDKAVWGWVHQRKGLGDEKGVWLESLLKVREQ
ncbi:uncharacterized protein KY384_006445 [Bacidia gigantensis]|uniref:uncharacterized protein n=1 Tax=Bacidia gigantensis TaxID=2732470 RepID=UPI001D0398D5|nr:uncharacterized protein KY384_006445 [Bacidia gigantensis]KAG8528758.1 hypothetical protein KY384_006445 [Bacidia gigantensis]